MWATPKSASRDENTGEKKNVSSVYNRSIVSKHQGTSYTLPSKNPTNNLAYRNYVKDVEKLRRELDRKDARNANIAQEMQQLRTKFSNQERELRILSGTFEKCNNERVKFQTDLSRTKEYADKLETQLSRLGDSVALVQTVDKLQLTNEHYASEIANLKGVLAFKDEKMLKMEKELEAFERALDVQAKYEAEDAAAGTEVKDASIKSLYYELGKRQTDAHSLAISLAGTNEELKDAKETAEKAQAASRELELQCKQAKSHSTTLMLQVEKDKEEITSLHDKFANQKGLNTRLQGMVEDLSRRLREERDDFLKYKQEKDNNEQELLHTLDNANKEIHHLRLRVKNLNEAVKLSDSKRVKAEEILVQEVRRFNDERRVYAYKIKDGIQASDQNKVLNMQLASAMKGAAEKTDMSSTSWSPRSPANTLTAKLEGQVKALEEDLERAHQNEKELLHDRESSVRALQQTLEATRELSTRHGEEKTRRVAAEQRVSAAEERAMRAERELATYTQSDNSVQASRDKSTGANKGVSFVGESEIFAPPVPPRQQQGELRRSQESAGRSGSAQSSEKHSSLMGSKKGSQGGGDRGGVDSRGTEDAASASTRSANVHASLRESRDSVMSDASGISTTSTAASSVADELARLRAELREIEDQKPK